MEESNIHMPQFLDIMECQIIPCYHKISIFLWDLYVGYFMISWNVELFHERSSAIILKRLGPY